MVFTVLRSASIGQCWPKTLKAYCMTNHSLIVLILCLFNNLIKSSKMNHREVFTMQDESNTWKLKDKLLSKSGRQSPTALVTFWIKVDAKHNHQYKIKKRLRFYALCFVSSLRKAGSQYISMAISVAVKLSVSYRELLFSLQFVFHSLNPGHLLLTVQLLYSFQYPSYTALKFIRKCEIACWIFPLMIPQWMWKKSLQHEAS